MFGTFPLSGSKLPGNYISKAPDISPSPPQLTPKINRVLQTKHLIVGFQTANIANLPTNFSEPSYQRATSPRPQTCPSPGRSSRYSRGSSWGKKGPPFKGPPMESGGVLFAPKTSFGDVFPHGFPELWEDVLKTAKHGIHIAKLEGKGIRKIMQLQSKQPLIH